MNVSVVLTCHNEASYIEQAVRSVVAQTASDRIAEILIVDDDSSDDSPRVLERLSGEISRLRVVRAKCGSVGAARNVAIRVSSAPLLAFLDGDDFWVADKLQRQLDALSANPDVGLLYSDFVDFTRDDASDGQVVRVRRFHADTRRTLSDYFVHDAPIVPSTTIIPRVVFDEVGVFDETLRLGEDTEMFLRIAERWPFQHVSGGLTWKRRHGGNLTRHLGALLPVNLRLTEQIIERHPELEAVAGQRLARRYARAGHDYARHGEVATAFNCLSRAMTHAPFYWRPYAYLALMLLPRRLRPALLRIGKRVYHGSLSRLRRHTMARESC